MWRSLGVICLWVLLIAAPHVPSSALELSVVESSLGVVPSATVPGDDPGDPFRQGPERAPAEIPGSFASLHFKNALGKTFDLLAASIVMDGKTLPAITNLQPDGDSVVFAGRVTPGEHIVDTQLTCQGRRRGPFTYLDEYRWEVKSKEVLTVPSDRAVIFTISAVRNKGANIPWDKQVGITAESEVVPNPLSLKP
ncbi:MAG TPA: hypothetical protein VMT47_01130 [Polyangia bacterium]|nr:hypothetical protein [Polyangia bacterium]